jgi:hypothetical protein
VTAERHNAVFTGLLSMKKPGEYPYLSMSDNPFGPGGGSTVYRGRPPYERMGREVPFEDLPEGCLQLVLDAYRELWGASEEGA